MSFDQIYRHVTAAGDHLASPNTRKAKLAVPWILQFFEAIYVDNTSAQKTAVGAEDCRAD
jgi:hypothetical protein